MKLTNYFFKKLDLILIIWISTAIQLISAQDVTTGRGLNLKFNESGGSTATDASGNNSNATVNTLATFVSGGISGNCLQFTGASTSDANVNSNAGISPSGAITVNTWMLVSNLETEGTILSKRRYNPFYQLFYRNKSWEKQIHFSLNNGAVDVSVPISNSFYNSWHMITGTHDGSNVKIYLDGVFVTSKPYASTISANTDQLWVGSQQYGSFFTGKLDEISIYNRALNSTDIKYLYLQFAANTAPASPTIGTTTAGNGQVAVAFTSTTSDITTGYTVSSNPGNIAVTGTSSPITVRGLTNGTPYTFTITATNPIGTSAPSSPSTPVTPSNVVPVPNAPTMGVASPGNGKASVTFTAPENNGGSEILFYTATSSPGGITTSNSTSPITITGLNNGTTYTFTVTATNANGTSAASNSSNSVKPSTSLPTGKYYYVATNDPNASDNNNGTSLSTPFKTIQKAANVAVAGDAVQIREGLYRETVTPANSGTSGNPIIFQPYNGESVTITGAEPITSWTLHSGNIYKAPMAGNFMNTSHNQTDQVFVDGVMMPLARWPNNTTFNPSFPEKSVFSSFVTKSAGANNITTAVFTDNKLPQNVDLVGAEIFIQPNYEAWSWTLTGKVSATSGTQVTLNTYNAGGKDGNGATYDSRSRYYLYNKLSLLDAPGEWYHDLATNTLYLWCPNNANPTTVKVEAKKRENAIDLTNLSYVIVKDLKVFASTITTDNGSGGDNKGFDAAGGVSYPWRGADFIASANNIKIDGVEASYITHYTDVSGHFFLQWGLSSGFVIGGTNNEVRNCKIQYSAGNGISAQGKGHKIINNIISDINYLASDASAINTVHPGKTEDVEIAYNTVKNTGRSAITPRSLVNASSTKFVARIHHNDASQYMLQDWDGGGVYSATGNHGFIRVDHNTFHDSGIGFLNSGVYFDWSANVIVDHNVIWNNDWPLHFQAYGDNSQNNTLCYNNTTLARNEGKLASVSVANSIGTNVGTVIQNNILVYADGANTTAPGSYSTMDATGLSSASKITNYTYDAANAGFVSLENKDYQLNSTAACKDAGTLFPDMVINGVKVPGFNDPTVGTVDIGAYEFGTTKFATGANLSPDTQDPTAPTALTAQNKISNKLLLTWEPSTDNVGITAYFVYQNDVFIGYTEHTRLQISGLTPTTSYKFNVRAVDYRGNISDAATINESTSNVDTQAPSIPLKLAVSDKTLTGFKAVWSPSTDNNYVEKYEVLLNGTSKGYVMHPDTSLIVKGLSANTQYSLVVKAYDGSGNVSTSTSVNVKTGDAALIIHESFNYEVGIKNADMDGTANGLGYPASNFEIASTGLYGSWGTNSTIVQGSLQYADNQLNAIQTSNNALALQNGNVLGNVLNYVITNSDPFGSYRLANKDFGANGTSLWLSVLLNCSDLSKDARIAFLNSTKKTNFSIGLKNQQWCIIDSTSNKVGGVAATANSTALLLMKVSYGNVNSTSRDDKVELWVNPNLKSTLPAADAVYAGMVGNFGRYSFVTTALSSAASFWTMDEFRIGLQKDDVLPIGVLSALDKTENTQRNVYPTLTSDRITVSGLEGYKILIYNIEGKAIKNLQVNSSNFSIDVSGFNKGLYFIKASGFGDSREFKFIVK